MERVASSLKNKLMSAQEAAQFVKTGMVVAVSGFTSVSYPKAVPEALAASGHARDLTICVGAAVDEGPAPRKDLLRDLANNGARAYVNTSVQEITDHSVIVSGEHNEEIPADTVVLAIGRVPNTTLANELIREGFTVHIIGDAKEPALAGAAIREGYLLGRHL